MKRRNLCALVLVGVSAWLAPAVHADPPSQTQAFSQGVTLKVDGETVANATKVYVNHKDCKEPATYEFTVTLTGTGAVQGVQVPVLEAWGTNSGQDCSDANNRKSGANGTKSACYLVWRSSGSEAIRVGQSNKVTVTADQLFQNNSTRDGKCDLNAPAPSSIGIYFVPLTAATPINTNDAPAPMPNAAVATAAFTLFTVQPESPTGISGNGGENELTAQWQAANIGGTSTAYRVYFDWGASGTGTPAGDAGTPPATTDAGSEADTTACGSGALLAGHDSPATSATLASVASNGTSASLADLDARKIPLHSFVAAAVVTVDVAGNESPLSEVVCIQRTETIGFGDQCQQDSSCKKQFDSCSAAPGRPVGTPLAPLTTAGLALVYWRRRTKNQR